MPPIFFYYQIAMNILRCNFFTANFKNTLWNQLRATLIFRKFKVALICTIIDQARMVLAVKIFRLGVP